MSSIDPAECWFQTDNRVDQKVCIAFGKFQVEHIDVRKFLEQAGCADRNGWARLPKYARIHPKVHSACISTCDRVHITMRE
jgi:hypothetical protein